VILVASALSLTLVVKWALKVLFATTSLGILLATVARSMPQFSLLAIPVFLILNMLSSTTSPLESMPQVLQNLVQASPAVHFVRFAQAVLYRAAGVGVVWQEITILAGLGTAFLVLALTRFRSMLAHEQR